MVNELDTIYRLRPEIKAFVEYDSLIPTRNARPSNDLFTDGVIEWLEFIEKHPKLTDTFVIDGSALALVFLWLQRIVSVLYPLTKRRYHKPENYKLIREQWNRLEKNVRFRIVLRLPKACYSFFCGRLCKC